MKSRTRLSLIILCSLSLAGDVVSATVVEQAVSHPVKQAISLRQSTQKEEEQWRAEKEKLTEQFDQLLAANRELTNRRDELETAVKAAEHRIFEKGNELAGVEQITSEISPVVNELYDQLEEIVASGLPFLPIEREKRIEALKAIHLDPSVAVSEKYRKVMEALLVEAEYGFTFDVYQQTISIGREPTLVDIFRLGRLDLYYLSLDQKACGFYNVATKTWQPLPVKDLLQVKKAVAIGRKQLPVELLHLPLGRISGMVQQ